MENLNVLIKGDNQVKAEKPPPRVCPRCNSDNTKFCYYNNYTVTQPRYFCKDCRRYWTHGGALRNIPIGGSSRKPKRPRMVQPSSVSQMVSFEIQQVNHHHPFLHVQETNQFVGPFGGSSSTVVVGNHFGPLPEIHGDVVTHVPPIRSVPPVKALDLSDVSFRQYYDVGSNGSIGKPLINQSIGGSVVVSSDHNNYRVGQENPNRWNQSFNNTMNMSHIASTSGSRGSSGADHMSMAVNNNKVRNKCVFRSSYHLEKHGP